MSDIVKIKKVPFMGTDLVAAKDTEDQIWVGVSWICKGLGLSKSQKDTQIQNIQNEEPLKQGCLKFQAGVFDANNATLALKLDFVPLWLAKISITPKMKEENPELANRLIEYQLKAKDVLAAAFVSQEYSPNMSEDEIVAKALAITNRRVQELTLKNAEQQKVITKQSQQIEVMKPKAKYCDIVLACKDLITITVIAKDYGKSAEWMNEYLHKKKIQYKRDGVWVLYQEYCGNGYTGTKTHTYTNSQGQDISKIHTYWTQKGRLFLYELLKTDGILPCIEQEEYAVCV